MCCWLLFSLNVDFDCNNWKASCWKYKSNLNNKITILFPPSCTHVNALFELSLNSFEMRTKIESGKKICYEKNKHDGKRSGVNVVCENNRVETYHNVNDAIIHCNILFDLKVEKKKENRVNYTHAELVFRLFISLCCTLFAQWNHIK